jgi:hypothetical protein
MPRQRHVAVSDGDTCQSGSDFGSDPDKDRVHVRGGDTSSNQKVTRVKSGQVRVKIGSNRVKVGSDLDGQLTEVNGQRLVNGSNTLWSTNGQQSQLTPSATVSFDTSSERDRARVEDFLGWFEDSSEVCRVDGTLSPSDRCFFDSHAERPAVFGNPRPRDRRSFGGTQRQIDQNP